MAHAWNPVRALIRLDDRVLGRWLNRPHQSASVSLQFALTVAIAVFAVVFAALTGYIAPPLVAIVAAAAAWYPRLRNARRGGH